MKVLVVGAGLVGCAMAIALKQRGYQVEVFEKRGDPRQHDLSAGRSINLIVTAKGINLFTNLGIWQEIKKITTPVFGRMMHALDGSHTYQPYGADDSEYNHSVSRGMLNNMLLDQVDRHGISVKFLSSLDEVDFSQNIAKFAGQDIVFEKIFGCDGAGSSVRRSLLTELGDKARYQVEPLGVDYKEFLMPANKAGEYVIDPKSLHIWSRGKHFLMALPNLDGSFTITLYMPAEWFSKFDTPEKVQKYFAENYADALALMPNLLDDYQVNPQGFLGTVRMDPWVLSDKCFLLGDAAHAMVPFFGQGMNSGMSDVQFIMDQVDAGMSWDKIAFEYQDFQKQNGDAIAELSLDNFREMSERVSDDQFLLRKKIENKLENAFPTKYRSRYGITVYTLIPYQYALAAGEVQEEILTEIMRDTIDVDQLDLEKAEKLIDGLLVPWFKQRKLDLAKYPIE